MSHWVTYLCWKMKWYLFNHRAVNASSEQAGLFTQACLNSAPQGPSEGVRCVPLTHKHTHTHTHTLLRRAAHTVRFQRELPYSTRNDKVKQRRSRKGKEPGKYYMAISPPVNCIWRFETKDHVSTSQKCGFMWKASLRKFGNRLTKGMSKKRRCWDCFRVPFLRRE